MNIGMHVSFWSMTFSGYMSRSGIKGPYGNSIFSFLKNFHTVLHSDCTNYISTNSVLGLSFFPHPLQHLLCVEFLMIAILTGVKWNLIVVLICIYLVISNVEHLFMHLLSICVSSLEKCLFLSFAYFLIRLFVFHELFIYFGKLSPFWSHHLQIISPSS